ncbi:hypothetical protein HMPREF2851_08450 [Actinomyces sp. HMSC064C12]|nr:hypothetical protein HMPREF2851_08450 [Actinomyces sp. HMSC064C12]
MGGTSTERGVHWKACKESRCTQFILFSTDELVVFHRIRLVRLTVFHTSLKTGLSEDLFIIFYKLAIGGGTTC